jgi:hypothetical protein
MSKRLMCMILGGAMLATACSTTAADSEAVPDDVAINSTSTATASQSRPAQAKPAPARRAAAKAAPLPRYRDVIIPAGTSLVLSLTSAVASDTSNVEDAVSAELSEAVMVAGRQAVPAGATVAGSVTEADNSGRVKGRAQVAFRFNTLTTGGDRYDMQTAAVSRMAPATKGEDATKIGIGAGAGALIGGLLGGKDGAAKGAVVGGGAGTGVVLATKGKEIRLAPGADVTTTLTAPLTIRIRTS